MLLGTDVPASGELSQTSVDSSVSSVSNRSESTTLTTVMKIYNGTTREKECLGESQAVQQIVKEYIWPNTKFLSNGILHMMDEQIGTAQEQHTAVGKLLLHMKKHNKPTLEKLKFWKTYNTVVQSRIQDLKSTTSQNVKKDVIRSK